MPLNGQAKKDHNAHNVSAKLSPEAKAFFLKASKLTGWSTSKIAAEVLVAWHDERGVVIAGHTEKALRAMVDGDDTNSGSVAKIGRPISPLPGSEGKASATTPKRRRDSSAA